MTTDCPIHGVQPTLGRYVLSNVTMVRPDFIQVEEEQVCEVCAKQFNNFVLDYLGMRVPSILE